MCVYKLHTCAYQWHLHAPPPPSANIHCTSYSLQLSHICTVSTVFILDRGSITIGRYYPFLSLSLSAIYMSKLVKSQSSLMVQRRRRICIAFYICLAFINGQWSVFFCVNTTCMHVCIWHVHCTLYNMCVCDMYMMYACSYMTCTLYSMYAWCKWYVHDICMCVYDMYNVHCILYNVHCTTCMHVCISCTPYMHVFLTCTTYLHVCLSCTTCMHV